MAGCAAIEMVLEIEAEKGFAEVGARMERLSTDSHQAQETLSRSLAKTVTYRVVIMILDFSTLYLFTGKIKIAVGFMVVSNVYTTVAYLLHERIWDRVKWGKAIYKVA